jgi:hypothetical protein
MILVAIVLGFVLGLTRPNDDAGAPSPTDRSPNVVHFGNERIDIVDQSMEFISYLSTFNRPKVICLRNLVK